MVNTKNQRDRHLSTYPADLYESYLFSYKIDV